MEEVKQVESKSLVSAVSFVTSKNMPIPRSISGTDLENIQFPKDLTILTLDQLGEAMGVWTEVIGYTQYEVAKAEVEKTARFNRYDFMKKRKYLELVEGSMNEETRKATVTTDTAIVMLQADYEQAKAKYSLMDSLLKVYNRYFTSLSRELSRRGVLTPGEPSDGRVSRANQQEYGEVNRDIEERKAQSRSLFAMSSSDESDAEESPDDPSACGSLFGHYDERG